MQAFSSHSATLQQSLALAHQHYENFPVASWLLPKHLRQAVAVIYRVAREADDLADEGDLTPEQRLQALQRYEDELQLIQAYIQPSQPLFSALQLVVRTHKLDVQLLLDLISAFKQDVVKTRYANFAEVLDYCQRSANPVGRLLLQLYQQDTAQHRLWSDQVCTALQLINFYQDIAIDLHKHHQHGRIYLCADEMQAYAISELDLRQQRCDTVWQQFFSMNLQRAEAMLQSGKPLGRALRGRVGLEVRMIIAAAERMLQKLKQCQGDIYQQRPTLQALDWPRVAANALFKRTS